MCVRPSVTGKTSHIFPFLDVLASIKPVQVSPTGPPIPLVKTWSTQNPHSLLGLVYEWKLIAFKPVYVSWQENTKSNFQTCTKEDPKNVKRMKRSQGREKLQLQKTCINHAMSGKQTIHVCYCSRINFSWNIDIINKKKNKNVRTASSQEKRKNHKNLYFGSFSPD